MEYLTDLKLVASRLKAKEEGTSLSVLEEGRDKSVMIVDSNIEMQDVFRRGLKKVGYRVLVMSDASRAIERCEAEQQVADCIVFGCHSLGKTGLDAFNRMGQLNQTKGMPAILLLAEKQANYIQEAALNDHRVVAKMPLKMRDFRGVLRKLLVSA
jgi:CheY-like chemotaxis protein